MEKARASLSLKSLWSDHWPVILLLFVGLLLGLWLGNDYGVTFDEDRNVSVGADALTAYTGSSAYFSHDHLGDHGPVYFMIFSATSRAIHALVPSWPEADGRHLTTYLTFLLGVAAFYVIGLKVLSRRGAWMATALFFTQPLLFGQGFINQKDTPFLSFFLVTVAAGLIAADQWTNEDQRGWRPQDLRASAADFRRQMAQSWQSVTPRQRAWIWGASAAAALVIADLLVFGWLRRLGETLLVAAYNGHAPRPIQALFGQIASDAYKTPLDLYLAKYAHAFTWAAPLLAGMVLLAALVNASLFLPPLAVGWGLSRDSFGKSSLLISAVFLGMAVCVRQVGVFAGGLVSLTLLFRGRTRVLFPMLVYWSMGAVVTVATWPWLWPNPIGRMIQSLALAASFPPHRTFFEGRWITSDILPWYYFPKLAGMELTEPTVVLVILGGLVAAWRLRRGQHRWFIYALLAIWAGVPLVALVKYHMTVYGNIRHLLFVLPPFLIAAGIALEALANRFRQSWVPAALTAMVILPGVWGIVQLHPYEYIYINSFAGGVSGAFGRYELDRQCISLRGAIEATNQLAPPGATVMVLRQYSAVVPYTRPDLTLIDNRLPYSAADFVLVCYWPRAEDLQQHGFTRVYEVKRGSAVLSDVWQRSQ
jgi:hypothetical protein